MLLQLFLFVVFYAIAKHLVGKARNLPPSPFPELPIIGHLYLVRKKPFHVTLEKIAKRYGPIIHLQLGFRRVLLVSSPSAAEECFSTNDVIFANRPHILSGKYSGNNYTSLAWSSYDDNWRNQRKIASLELLSSYRIHTLADIRADEVRLLIKRIANNCEGAVKVKNLIYEMTFNVMMRMIAGRRYFGETGVEVKEVEALFEESFATSGMSFVGDYLPFLKWIGYGGMEKRLKRLKKMRDDFMQDQIKEHRRERARGEKDKTLIRVLLSSQKDQPEYYRDDMIRSLMLVLLAAGTDTSTSVLEWGLSFLLNNPKALAKTRSEIDKVVGFDRLIEMNDLDKLPYLKCVITETLRLQPPAPLLPHESSEDCTVGGYRVPKGTMLIVNVYAIQNYASSDWADASEFRPERFEGAETTISRKNGCKMMPFGYGRRGCPGENLAWQMLGLTLGSLIQCFDLERIGNELVDMTVGTGLTVPKAKPLIANCKPRAFLRTLLALN